MTKKKSKDSPPKPLFDTVWSGLLERIAMFGQIATTVEQIASAAIKIGVTREQFVDAATTAAGSLYDVAALKLKRSETPAPGTGDG
ncbi:MAG: hypothetical protein JRD89_02220 [Deltaproteobacteria bacterium]|nr:hypothetical protein [Deltaproteobacteria bacterium]